jgi:hypothetical protein
VREKDASVVTLTLQKGVTGVVIAPLPPAGKSSPGAATSAPTNPNPSSTPPAPAPYDATANPTPALKQPSSTGLLVGLRPAVFSPGGSVAQDTKFKSYAGAGPGIGIDLMARVGRVVLLGGTLEFASLGGPDATTVPQGTHVDVTNTSVYAGLLVGMIPNVDRVSFIGDVGMGMRFFSHSVSATGTNTATVDQHFSGLEFGLKMGLSIPAGPIRIVPDVGIGIGGFTSSDCSNSTVAFASCASNASATNATTTALGGGDTTPIHTFLTAGLGLYWNIDLSKKPKAASSAPPAVFTATR